MMQRLTDIAIQKLRPGPKSYEVPDPGARGLRVAVYPTGRKSFIVRYRTLAGRTRKLTLPGGTTLTVARKLAAEALFAVAQGKDPAAAKQAERHTARAQVDDTVERLASQFITQYAKRQTRVNSWRQTEGIFRNHIIPVWGTRSVHEIERRDVRDLLDGIAGEAPVMANRTRAILSKWFAWLAERDVIAASPMIGVRAPTKEHARERVFSDDELVRLWRAAEAIGGSAGACIKLLVLTGARRSEIAHLEWSEVPDGDTLVLPAERMKGRAAHVVPLSTQACAIIDALPRTGPYVFGKAPVGHWHRIKPELDRHMGDAQHWVIHDIRCSVATGMAKLGVAVPTIERLLAHKIGTFKGVVSVYQRHSYLPEVAVAVQKWANRVEQLVAGESGKVVQIRTGGR
jgi:integrase